MEIFGYFAALLVGLTLGLMGAGGSILTVPILVYLFKIDPELSTAYSLFIVGITALIGAIPNMKRHTINYKAAIIFFIPSLSAVYFTRAVILQAIPENIFTIGDLVVTKDVALLLLFAIVMIIAATSMIRRRKTEDVFVDTNYKINIPMMVILGLAVGLLTGMIGAGGGFLIIPALVVFAKLPMKTAIGTSLLIIAINSMVGFAGDGEARQLIDVQFMLIFSAITIAGILFGSWLSNFVQGAKLKGAFGWFVLGMGILIIMEELFLEL